MDMKDQTPAPSGQRRRYEPPTISTESIFETTALACAKTSNQKVCTSMGVARS